jgi:TolB protein
MMTDNAISTLETIDIHTQERTVLHRFEGMIEAPNWTRDGTTLVYNSHGA